MFSVFRISLETLDADLQSLTYCTRSLEENAQKDTELLQQLESFFEVTRTSTHQCGVLMIDQLILPANSGQSELIRKKDLSSALVSS